MIAHLIETYHGASSTLGYTPCEECKACLCQVGVLPSSRHTSLHFEECWEVEYPRLLALMREVRQVLPEHDSDAIALITQQMRQAVMKVGLDPMGATETELGIAKAIEILARALHAGTIADYREGTV